LLVNPLSGAQTPGFEVCADLRLAVRASDDLMALFALPPTLGIAK
jgi:hypothetical protein